MDTALTSSTATLRPGAAEVAAHDGTGTRLATVCNDDTLKIYATDTGKLELSASMQVSWPNSSTQARISWAPSDFGQVLATSSGATIHIWAEVKQVHRPQGWRLVQSWHAGSQIWDIAFSPKEYGALLAVSCADGKLRIYGGLAPLGECCWELVHTIRCTRHGECTSLCWREANGPGCSPLIIAGCNDGTSGIWQYEESAMAWVVRDLPGLPPNWSMGLVVLMRMGC